MTAPPVTLDTHILVALGANLGDAAVTLREAFARVAALAAGPAIGSGLWRTEPVDCPPGAPPFLNAVMAFEPRPDLTPERLLGELQRLERAFGRRPKQVLNEPRPLDLDLIAFRRETRATPALILPHPRAHLRAFVLAPLAEIAPDLRLPGQTASVRALLAALPATRPAPVRLPGPGLAGGTPPADETPRAAGGAQSALCRFLPAKWG